jgi:hypothetical protein
LADLRLRSARKLDTYLGVTFWQLQEFLQAKINGKMDNRESEIPR